MIYHLEEDLNNIVLLAAQICDAPISAILFSVNGRTIIKAEKGIIKGEKHLSFFNTDKAIVVTDILADHRFNDLKILNGKNYIRFFTAIPIKVPDGYPCAQLCVMNYLPGNITDKQFELLNTIANEASTIIKIKSFGIRPSSQDNFSNLREELACIFYNAIDAMIVINEDGIIQLWNPKASLIFGWTKEEAIGKLFHTLLLPDRFQFEHQRILGNYNNHVDFKNVTSTYIEISAFDKYRNEIQISLGISPTSLRNFRFYICSINDITGRKLIAAQLDKQKEFYENILNKLPTDIAVFDAEHKYLFVNPGAISVEEYRKFIIGKDDYQYAQFRNRPLSTADGRRAQFLEVKNTGKEIRWEDTLPDPNGVMITHLRRMFPVHNEKGELTMVIGFGIDITDRKLMEEKQAELVDQLSSQNIQLFDFCNIVSHNLRGPLVNMSMLVKFIENTEDLYKQRLYISKLKPVLDTLHSTFNELVESIQIKQDLEIESEQINLDTCLKRTLEGLDSEITKAEAIIETDFADAPSIYFPPKYVYSIFYNFLSNSLKYQLPNRKLVVKLKSKKYNEKILLSVSDNGRGIDLVKHRDSIFKIGKVFHRHPNAKGFGLYMTKTQVEAMNSKIWVESTPEIGSTFYIEFANQKL